MKKKLALLAIMLASVATPAVAQDAEPTSKAAALAKENDGTDPTQLSTAADVSIEHLDLRNGFDTQTLTFGIGIPVGEDKRTSIRLKVPFAANDVLGNDGLGLGDMSVKVTRVLKVTRKYGIVVGGELAFDTASRIELGSGKTVFKGSFVYAMFQKNGAIFAPSLVHNISIAGKDTRSDVNSTTLDLYYVPRLKNRQLFMTIDPAFTYNWENDDNFASLSVTMGRKLGKMLGGAGQISVKPTIFIGADRGANWGMQMTFKVLNF
jgi:hypothetical protein